MASAPLPLESPPCPVCGTDAHITVLKGARDHVWGKPGEFQIQHCTQCGLAATRPRPQSIGFYYEDTYSGEAEERMRRFQTEDAVGKLIAYYRLRVLTRVRNLTPHDHVLDVGCSYGGFLNIVRRTYGCAVSGIDLDAESIKRAIDPEVVDYRVGDLLEADFPPASFSVITFLESLEHHKDPVATLRKARQLLRPGGVCVVEVPNYGGFWRRVFGTAWLPLLVPQHLYHFTPSTLKKTMQQAGLGRVRHQQTMFYPLEGIASLGIWLSKKLRLPRPGQERGWQKPLAWTIGLMLCALYPLLEIPSQALLRLCGLAGHQILIAGRETPKHLPSPSFE